MVHVSFLSIFFFSVEFLQKEFEQKWRIDQGNGDAGRELEVASIFPLSLNIMVELDSKVAKAYLRFESEWAKILLLLRSAISLSFLPKNYAEMVRNRRNAATDKVPSSECKLFSSSS